MIDLNVLEFCESELNIKLYPLQKTLLKIIFGVPLDYEPQTIDVWDDLHETKLYSLSEPDYLNRCYSEGRCNYGWHTLPPNGFNEVHLFQGRRGGKTTLLMVAAAYKLYRTLQLGDPQGFFNLIRGSAIDLTLISMDDNSVRRMHESLYDYYISRAKIFAPYLSSYSPGRDMRFYTELERERAAWNSVKLQGSVNIGAYPATANVTRGPSSIGLFLDEFAHFKNADNLYTAVVPSTLNFRTEDVQHSLIMSASSPWYTNGKMFQLHEMAFTDKSIFTHNETTATLYPGASYPLLRQQKDKGTKYFEAEFCGKFVPTLGGMDSRGRVADETPIDFKEYRRRKGSK